MYTIVLISAVQQGSSDIYMYVYMCVDIYIHYFLMFYFILVYHRILNIYPCAIL